MQGEFKPSSPPPVISNEQQPVNWDAVPFRIKPCLRVFAGNLTYNQALESHRQGQISSREWRWYVLFWVWSAARFSDVEQAASKQDRFCETHGFAALQRRIQRMNALRSRVYRTLLLPYLQAMQQA